MSNDQGNEKDLSDIQNMDFDLPPDPQLNQPYDVPLDKLLSDEVNTFTPEEIKKMKQIGWGALALAVLVALLSVYSCQPRQGPMAYGICSTFLELNTFYPHTLNYYDLEGSRTSVRIYFTNTDPFGEFKQEMIECKFAADEKMGMKLAQVLRNRREVDPVLVEKFNIVLPTIMASKPYTVMPPDWKNPLVPD